MQQSLGKVLSRLPVTKQELEIYSKRIEELKKDLDSYYDAFIVDTAEIHKYMQQIKHQAFILEDVLQSNSQLKEYVNTLVPATKEDLEHFWDKVNKELEENSRLKTRVCLLENKVLTLERFNSELKSRVVRLEMEQRKRQTNNE